jgi:energy-coupling factor transporter ATP-binding protein EcfA2
MLKWRGLYSVHAAGAASDGRAVVLAGPSGSGKSTLALALARHGLDYMGDDMLFATHLDGKLLLHAFPEEVDVSPSSAAWFDELAAYTGAPPPGWPKHRIHVDETFGARVAAPAVAAALVFPAIDPSGRTTLEPLTADEALIELGPNVLLTDAAMAQRHLDVLGELARSAPAYRLAVGRDLAHAADLLAELLRP